MKVAALFGGLPFYILLFYKLLAFRYNEDYHKHKHNKQFHIRE